jgi:hypothetical protein
MPRVAPPPGHLESPTAVIAVAVNYPWIQYALFIMTLRAHYDGDIIILGESSDPDVLHLFKEQRVQVEPFSSPCQTTNTCEHAWMGVERFHKVASLCERYSMCLSADFRDTFFQADPFATLLLPGSVPAADIVLNAEALSIRMSYWGRLWARRCLGDLRAAYWSQKIINSGTIFCTPVGCRYLAKALTATCPEGNVSDKSGMDQTLLIHHFYSGQMAQANLSTVLNGRGIGPAYSLRYALVDPLWYSHIVRYAPPGEQIRFPHLLPFTIHNDDNSSTAVCHQYDVDWRLKALMYGAALCYHAQHYASNASNRTHHNQYCEQRGLTVANAKQLTRRICNNVSSVCRDVVTSA